MSEITEFSYPDYESIRAHQYGTNRPVVYILSGGKEVYVGETIKALNRTKEHYKNQERKRLDTMYLISDNTFNKSSALDIESRLIQYMVADQKFTIQNRNGGLKSHNYYNRELYQSKFEIIWEKLQGLGLANGSLLELRNSDLFKYSPYKALNEDQLLAAEELIEKVTETSSSTTIVHGKPGTGKTILATYLCKALLENPATSKLNVGLVVPMSGLRKTLEQVFKSIKGLKANMILGPGDVVKKEYDILLVDESHRLLRRNAISQYGPFDKTNAFLGLGKEGTQLDWICKSSKHQIFFYDENQSIRPSDISAQTWKQLDAEKMVLETQMRVQGGAEYISLVNDIFDRNVDQKSYVIPEYDIQLFDDIQHMYETIQEKNNTHGLCRLVAGFAWEWVSNKPEKGQEYDIEIDGYKLKWNHTTKNRVNSPGSEKEVGCIHTIQGYDLNYVGVIIGDEISYDPISDSFVISKKNYKDTKGKLGLDEIELERYIINIYKTMMTRGILGTYVFVVDPKLREYVRKILENVEKKI